MSDLSMILGDFPRGDPGREPKREEHQSFRAPTASFFDPAKIVRSPDFTYRRGRIFLGVLGGRIVHEETPIGRKGYVMGGSAIGIADDRHLVTVAGSRTGKGRSCILPNMLLYPGSVIATDTKGDLATLTAHRRASVLSQKVYVLDPFEVVKGEAAYYRTSFNPLAVMRDNAMEEDAALIADAIVVTSPNDRDPHWDESARNFIEGVILHVATADFYSEHPHLRTLVTVRKLVGRGLRGMDKTYSMKALEIAMRGNPARDGAVQMAAADFFDRADKERDSVLSTARRHLKFLAYPGIQSVVSEHGFSLDELKKDSVSIYLCLPARHMGTCSRWFRLFVNLTLQAMERIPEKPANGVPVLCCLDEFASLGHMRQIEDAAGQIAGFGVILWPILQDIGQLKALYKERWESFLANAGTIQVFGNNDLTTLKWISERCGKTSIQSVRRNDVTGAQFREGNIGVSSSIEVHDLITAEEISRYFGRDDKLLRQLIIGAGHPPIVLQRAFYDKHELFENSQAG
jgi:type IV secretion system protein VirD4